MLWLVCYDVADDQRRQKLANVLLDYGERVQGSVFWLDADEELAGRIRERSRRVIDEGEDSLWIVPLCGGCGKRVEAYGRSPRPELPEYYIL